MQNSPDVEDLLAKARRPSGEAMRLHPLYRGKLEVTLKCPIRDFSDFAIWYTPGVAAPCRDIAQHPDKVFDHTNKGNAIAIVSDGSRVLGLGDIGPWPNALRITAYQRNIFCSGWMNGISSLAKRRPWALKPSTKGLARHALTREALFQKAAAVIKRARDGTHALMEKGIIPITA